MANESIRDYAKIKGVTHWRIAEALHLNEAVLSRKLRRELPPEDVEKIRKIIDSLSLNDSTGFLCPYCTFGDFGGFHGYKPNYCPNCGKRMNYD